MANETLDAAIKRVENCTLEDRVKLHKKSIAMLEAIYKVDAAECAAKAQKCAAYDEKSSQDFMRRSRMSQGMLCQVMAFHCDADVKAQAEAGVPIALDGGR